MYQEFATPSRSIILGRESSNYERGVESQITRSRELSIRIDWKVGPDDTHVISENDSSAFTTKELSRNAVGRPAMGTDRPKLEHALDMLWTGEADGLLADAIDRIARNVNDGEKLIVVMRQKGIMIATVAHGIIKPDNYGISLIRREVERAESESLNTQRRANNGKRNKAMRGESNNDGGGIRSFGWEKDGTAIPHELEWLAWAARTVLNGRSIAYVTQRLTANVPTVTGNDTWNRSSIHGAITNPRVAGISHHKWVPMRDSDGEYIMGNWEPAISVEDWEEVCKELKERADLNTTNRNGWVRKYLGSQLYECGKCDNGQTLSGTQAQYRCDYRNLSRKREWVDNLVDTEVIKVLSQPESVELFRPRSGTSDITSRTKELARLHRKRRGTIELAGTFSKREINAQVAQVERDIKRIEAELASLQSGDDPGAKVAGRPEKWWDLELEEQRSILSRLFRVVVMPARVPKCPDPSEVRIIRLRPRV